jgi:hypothetical protein
MMMVQLKPIKFSDEHDRLPKYSLRVRIPLPALNSGSLFNRQHPSQKQSMTRGPFP